MRDRSAAARCVQNWLAAVLLLGAGAALAADALPPERPTTPYEAKVRNVYSATEAGGGSSGGDTYEIHVSGARLYEDAQILDEKTVIVDTEARTVLEFDPAAADKVAGRFPLNATPIPYVGGRAALAAFDPQWGAPRVAGADRVAKQKCTVLHWGDPEKDGIAACVSAQGVVMRARIVWPGYEREFELLDFEAGEQDAKWFSPPQGFRIVEGE